MGYLIWCGGNHRSWEHVKVAHPAVDVEGALYLAPKDAVNILARHDDAIDCRVGINCTELHEMRAAIALYESKGKL